MTIPLQLPAEIINPYKFCDDFQRNFRMLKNGEYEIIVNAVSFQLGIKVKKTVIGSGCKLTTSGVLTLYKGFRWNGPNVVQDAMSKIMAAAIHDALYDPKLAAVTGYLDKQTCYYRVCVAQGASKVDAGKDWLGLVLGAWCKSL